MTHPLDDLLDQTHQALLAGDLSRLGTLAPQVDSAATPVATDSGTAQRLRRKAERNARLLQAALRGLRAARGQMDAVAGGADVTTYDAQGRKSTLARVRPLRTKRV